MSEEVQVAGGNARPGVGGSTPTFRLPLDRTSVDVSCREKKNKWPRSGKTDQVPLAWFHHPEQATGKYRGMDEIAA